MIGWLWDFIRELAVLAAAGGIAKWAWDQHVDRGLRRDQEAERALDQGRLKAERQAAEDRMRLKVRIHKLLHATSEPFLTFAELRQALAQGEPASPAEDLLRRCVMELVSDGCAGQMEGDRYYVGGEFEPEEGSSEPGQQTRSSGER